MDTNPLFTIALGLGSPWEVQRTEFDPAKRVLRLRVDFKAGSRFCCPECEKPGCPVHDTVELLALPWVRPGSDHIVRESESDLGHTRTVRGS